MMSRRLVHLDQLQTRAGQRTTVAPRYLSLYLSTDMQMPNRDHIHLFRKWKRLSVSEFSHITFILLHIFKDILYKSRNKKFKSKLLKFHPGEAISGL